MARKLITSKGVTPGKVRDLESEIDKMERKLGVNLMVIPYNDDEPGEETLDELVKYLRKLKREKDLEGRPAAITLDDENFKP